MGKISEKTEKFLEKLYSCGNGIKHPKLVFMVCSILGASFIFIMIPLHGYTLINWGKVLHDLLFYIFFTVLQPDLMVW